jgi:hypothetical protein
MDRAMLGYTFPAFELELEHPRLMLEALVSAALRGAIDLARLELALVERFVGCDFSSQRA